MASVVMIRELPEDVYNELVKEQARIRIERKTKINLGTVIVIMLRRYIKQQQQNESPNA